MKKLFSIILFSALVSGWLVSSASNCTINTSNTTTGVTPTGSDTVTQGVAYSQTLQVYVPATYSAFTVDSVHITSITGAPSGLTIVYNPASQTINGGSNGAVCFNGTTSAPVGTYPLTFTGNIYTSAATVPLSALAAQFSYSFIVKAPAPAPLCDTVFNVTNIDTPEVFIFGQGQSGYLAGNNSYGDEAKAEKFYAAPGNELGGGIVFFSVVTINPGDSTKKVYVNLWDTTGAGGSPGNVIATDSISLRQIAVAVTQVNTNHALYPTYVNFSPSYHLISGSFFYWSSVTYNHRRYSSHIFELTNHI